MTPVTHYLDVQGPGWDFMAHRGPWRILMPSIAPAEPGCSFLASPP